MCIIVMKPEGKILTRAQVQKMWTSNSDGAGIMYSDNEVLQVVKGLMTLKDLWESIKEAGVSRKMCLHFRIKTHGANNAKMTHPFWIMQDKLAMMHNGVIRPCVNEANEQNSDTYVFAKQLSNGYRDPLVAIQNDFHRAMIESYIGYSKLVFMDNTGQTYILNENAGTWDDGIWYSNTSFKSYGNITTYGTEWRGQSYSTRKPGEQTTWEQDNVTYRSYSTDKSEKPLGSVNNTEPKKPSTEIAPYYDSNAARLNPQYNSMIKRALDSSNSNKENENDKVVKKGDVIPPTKPKQRAWEHVSGMPDNSQKPLLGVKTNFDYKETENKPTWSEFSNKETKDKDNEEVSLEFSEADRKFEESVKDMIENPNLDPFTNPGALLGSETASTEPKSNPELNFDDPEIMHQILSMN